MSTLDVVPNDPGVITAELVAQYEAATGKTVYPAQIERLLIDLIAYRETLLRAAINDAARQNLVRFARAPMLDYLGELVGVARLAAEDDERLRARILQAPEGFSVAGPVLAYRHHAMAADAAVLDVAVTSPEPGVVTLYPLSVDGLPSAALQALVLARVSADDVRPLCDTVRVEPPLDVPFVVQAQVTVLQAFDSASVLAAAVAGVQTVVDAMRVRLGADVVRSALSAALHVPGVYRVDLLQPAADVVVPEQAWAHCTALDVTLAGASHG